MQVNNTTGGSSDNSSIKATHTVVFTYQSYRDKGAYLDFWRNWVTNTMMFLVASSVMCQDSVTVGTMAAEIQHPQVSVAAAHLNKYWTLTGCPLKHKNWDTPFHVGRDVMLLFRLDLFL